MEHIELSDAQQEALEREIFDAAVGSFMDLGRGDTVSDVVVCLRAFETAQATLRRASLRLMGGDEKRVSCCANVHAVVFSAFAAIFCGTTKDGATMSIAGDRVAALIKAVIALEAMSSMKGVIDWGGTDGLYGERCADDVLALAGREPVG